MTTGDAAEPPANVSRPPYGQHAPSAGTPHTVRPATRSFGVVGATLVLLGGVACVLAFTVLNWRSGDKVRVFSAADAKFSNVHKELNQLHSQVPNGFAKYVDYGVSRMYFSWLAWVLLAAAVVVGLLAVLPNAFSGVLRVLGPIVGLAGVGLTFWAIDLASFSGPYARQLGSSNPGYSDYLNDAGPGFWLAAAGLLVIGLGALLGPRRVRATVAEQNT